MNAILKSMAALSLASLLPAGAVAQEAETVNFGIISTESQSNLRPKWEPFLADMEEKTGLEVEPFFASDYAGVIEGMRFGQVQLAWFGNKSAMEAVDRAEGEVFVQTVAADGSPGYWSVIIVPAESELTSLEDLLVCDQSLDFGIGDVNSTSGYLVPMTFVFSENGVDPQDCFANVTNANHETNAMAVANGQVDAAANNTESMALIEKNAPDAFANIKEIWRSPLIPSDPIVWSADLSQDAKDKIKAFFVTYGTEQSTGDVAAEKEVLAGLAWAPFRESSNDQLLPIRVMEVTREMAELEADTAMAEADKAARMAELQAQKAELDAALAATPQG